MASYHYSPAPPQDYVLRPNAGYVNPMKPLRWHEEYPLLAAVAMVLGFAVLVVALNFLGMLFGLA